MSRFLGANNSGVPDPIPTSPDAVFLRPAEPSPRSERSQTNSIPGAHWAKELIGRIRSNSIHHPSVHHYLHFHHSIEDSEPNHHLHNLYQHAQHPRRQRRHSAPRDAEPAILDPETIDPRRLPKTHGPTSACLQFSKKPLQHITSNSSTSTPIPVNMSPVHFYSGVTSATGSSDQSQLSCSAIEELRGAVDILAGRCQAFPSTTKITRVGVRVKRASESEHLLVVSRSLSDSKEEFPTCSFGHFDENHVYGTLFRHSTCYDVLPDSGKLVVLDSKLGVVRAIRALLENGVQAAPIWHAATQRVTGLFSQDFALHLLSSLYHYGSVTEMNDQASSSPTVFSDSNQEPYQAATDPTSQSNSIAHGLRIWGSKRLSDVLRLFYPPEHHNSSPEFADSALIVPPQMGLQKALCRLVHKSHSHRIHSRHRSKSESSDLTQNSLFRSDSGKEQHRLRSKPVRQNSMDLFDWEFPENFILGPFPDAAVEQPVNKILETKIQVTCLVLFDVSAHSSWASPHLVGMVTAKDLLQAIVTTEPHNRHRHRSHLYTRQHCQHNATPQSVDAQSTQSTEPMLVDEVNDDDVSNDEVRGDTDPSDVSDPCAHALGLTHSQHVRLQQTHSNSLLGLSHPNSSSHSSSSLSSGSTFSAGCSSASEFEECEEDRNPEQDAGEPNLNDTRHLSLDKNMSGSEDPARSSTHSHAQPHQYHHRVSSASSDCCSCACHQSGSAPIAQLRPTNHWDGTGTVPYSIQSHPVEMGNVTETTGRSLPYPRATDSVDNRKTGNSFTIRLTNTLATSVHNQKSPTSPTTASSAPPVRIPIVGPPTSLDTAFNNRQRRSQTRSQKKICKRDEDDSVFRMDQ
ncbi:unnamed protein product [Echinostoma caproni]|uniref:CBS domain-containing protein n=1 Tax=Echinostoma caproni TaxID=27848 RepID=A0A183AAH7_9TREM|nr:unnamed protein product [Echinostoma caproni]